METFWDKVKKSVDEGATYLSEKTEQFTRIGKLKMEIVGLKRKVDAKFTSLGKRVFQLVEQGKGKAKNPASDEEVLKIVEDVKRLQKELDEKKVELEAVSKKESKNAEASPEQSAAE